MEAGRRNHADGMARIHASSRPIRDGPDQRFRTGDAALQDLGDGLQLVAFAVHKGIEAEVPAYWC